jgi:ATP-dependent Clp protease ATP-binding subunit ClpC
VFRQLDTEQLAKITDLLLDETRRRLAAQGIAVEFSPEAVAWLAERGYEAAFGARPLRRVIQREVDNPLSRMLLTSDLHAGQQILVTVAEDTLRFEVTDRPGGTEPNTVAEAPESAEV